MNLNVSKYIFFTLFFLFGLTPLKAQRNVQTSVHLDLGKTNASNGVFIKSAGLGEFQYNKYKITGGAQFDIKNQGTKVFTGSTLLASREFIINKFPFEAGLLYTYNPFSKLMYESNWGILLKTTRKHFSCKLGTNFRSYSITNKAMEEYGLTSNKKINEKWNLMYSVQYNLKPQENKWNVGITFTNIDYFIINQVTNPLVNLHGKYQISNSLKLFAQGWYKNAGALNISVNYFGFFVRTGLIWKIDLEK